MTIFKRKRTVIKIVKSELTFKVEASDPQFMHINSTEFKPEEIGAKRERAKFLEEKKKEGNKLFKF